MKPNALKTERDYQAAVAHIERLMEAPAPDEAELKLWSLHVANYEETHFPIDRPNSLCDVDSLSGSLGTRRAPVSIKKMKMGAKNSIARAGQQG